LTDEAKTAFVSIKDISLSISTKITTNIVSKLRQCFLKLDAHLQIFILLGQRFPYKSVKRFQPFALRRSVKAGAKVTPTTTKGCWKNIVPIYRMQSNIKLVTVSH